jgi:MOSC domain-containing protein YiiM
MYVCLEITQIWKKCHNECEIFKKMGKCIMPTNGVFARVIKGGIINVGDEMQLL